MSVETSTTILRSPSQPFSKDGVFRDGPRSLIISPNLDALLEHEERVNRGARSATCMGLSSSPIAVSPTGSEGLPPPPRGHKKARPKCEGAEDIPLPMSPIDTNWPASNPYINPAPSLAEVLGNSNESRRSSMVIHDNTTRIENEHDNENGAGGRTAETAGMTQGPGDGRDACDNKDRHPSQQSQSRYVERLFSLSRTAFRLRFDGTIQKNQNAQLPSPTNIRDRARLRVMEDLPVFDIRRFGGGPGNPLNPQHEGSRRPLHSHAPSSRSPTASHRSSSSTSTTRPSSIFNSPDPRISISSTIYPASSHSHSHTLYDTAESPPFLSSTKPLARHRTSPSAFERHSFIEILSPSSPAFPSIDTPQPSAGDMNLENFWSGRTRFSSAPSSRDRSSSPKPPSLQSHFPETQL
ncbi:hypothetical protein BD779DRAFT_63531 [Infundibulicybe gibba]|nr:hypothetical protein BD779DRAFT_63531 [Infundibulicybe gibba]